MEPIVVRKAANQLEKVYAIADSLNVLFKNKSGGPYEIISRLLEEAGEVSAEVSRMENNGIKQKKNDASPEKLADEVLDVLKVICQLIRHYQLEEEVDLAIEREIKIAVSHKVLFVQE